MPIPGFWSRHSSNTTTTSHSKLPWAARLEQLLTRYEQTRPPPPVTSPPVHFVDEEAFSNSGQQSELANSGVWILKIRRFSDRL